MKKLIKDRHDYIIEYCRWKKVLHLGCIWNSYQSVGKYEPWLHKEICDVSKTCVWVDFDKERIPFAEKASNSKIHYWDVQNFAIGDTFEVVVAAEIIEHIEDFRGFFDSIKKHLAKDGILIITTPNVFNFSNIIRVIGRWQVLPDRDHVVFFDLFTLQQMMRRNNFEYITYYYNTELAPQRIKNMIIRGLGYVFPILNLNLMVVAKCVE